MRPSIFGQPLRPDGVIPVPGTGSPPDSRDALLHTVLRTPGERWVALVETSDGSGEAAADRIVELWNNARFDLVSPYQLAIEVIGEIARRPDLRSCRSYSELHNHCDANDFAAIARHAPNVEGIRDEDAQAVSDAFVDVLEGMQSIVDRMLREGLFKTPETDEKPVQLVVVTDESPTATVYAPDGWYLWSEAVHINATSRVGGAHAALLEARDHALWEGYRQIPVKTR